MSQVTSYTIGSSPLTMSAHKSNLEAIFGALGSCNRGPTAPDNPVEGMLWWDTGTAGVEILKRYTVAIGWSPLGTLDTANGDWTPEVGDVQAFRSTLGIPSTVIAKSTAYTAVAADRSKLIHCTAALTLSLTAAATLGDGWYVSVQADGGDVTLDPDGSETINGAATLAVPHGTTARVWCDGTAFYSSVEQKTAVTVRLSADQGPIFANTETKIQFDSVVHDTRGEWDTASHRFTAEEGGYYRFTASGYLSLGTVIGSLRLRISTGESIYNAAIDSSGSSSTTLQRKLGNLSVVHYLAAGDWVDFAVFVSSSGGPSLQATGSGQITFASVERVA